MPLLYLTPYAHAAIIDQDSVWLDLREDAYLCLPDAGIRQVDASTFDIADPETAAALIELGLVSTKEGPDRRKDLPRPPQRDSSDFPEMTSAGGKVSLLLRATLQPYLKGRRAIAGLVSCANRWPRPQTSSSTLAASLTLARSVNAWLRWAPGSGACLQHSFALAFALRHAGLPATLVIGVQTWPFLAHAWVQAGDVALNDTAERLAGFEPILAVG